MLDALLIGNGNIEIEAGIRNDNSSVVEHIHSINSVAKERGLTGSLEVIEGIGGANPWLALSHIEGPLNISDEMTKSTSHAKLIYYREKFRNR